jgi:putative MATE family efflux protein
MDTKFRTRQFLLFALPLSLQALLENLVGLTDNFMVGSLGPACMAALTIASRYYFFLNILILAVVCAVNILCAQAWGRQDTERFKACYGTAAAMLLAFAAALSAALFFLRDPLVGLMASDPEVRSLATGYMGLMSLIMFASSANIVLSGLFIASGDTRTPFLQQLAVTGLNVALNYLLIFGNFGFPRLSVAGAGVASLIALSAGNVLLAARAARTGRLPGLRHFRPRRDIAGETLRLGAPILGDMVIWQASTILYVKLASDFGPDSTAAWGVAGVYMMIQSVLVMGFINGAGVKVGQLLGRGDGPAAERYASRALRFTMAVALAANAGLAALAFVLPGYFRFTAQAFGACTGVLLVMAAKHVFQTGCGYFSAVLRAGKQTLPLLWMSLGSFLLVGLPLAVLAGPVLKGGIVWIAIALAIEEICKAGVSGALFAARRWSAASRPQPLSTLERLEGLLSTRTEERG